MSNQTHAPISDATSPESACQDMNIQSFISLTPWSISLTTNESILLSHYIQRFSRTYPTCQGPTNPFLLPLLPYALNNRAVLDALLALSGAQHWESHGTTMEATTLQLRHRALRGCQSMLLRPEMKAYIEARTQGQSKNFLSASEVLPLISCCALLLLYEKLVGNGKSNWMPHLSFLATMFKHLSLDREQRGLDAISQQSEENEIFQFLHNLFLYNDLVHSTATGTITLSDYYLTSVLGAYLPSARSVTNRYYYPHLVAQIAAGNPSVTDADIDAWDGRLDWLPSFSSSSWDHHGSITQNGPHNTVMAAQLYRYTAKILLRQSAQKGWIGGSIVPQDTDSSSLAEQAAQNLAELPDGSSLENALLWPIGICARKLTESQVAERTIFIDRLRQLERRFHMRFFERMQDVLKAQWAKADGLSSNKASSGTEDVFLLG